MTARKSVALVLCLGAAAATEPTTAASARWCGPRDGDYACKTRGAVTVESAGARTALQRRRITPIAGGTAIRSEPRSEAKITFGRDALCTVGSRDQRTTLITRWRDRERLFRQDSGQTFCSYGRDVDEPLLVCGETTRCPVVVDVSGSTIVLDKPRVGQARSAQAAGEVPRQTIIDVCAGYVSIRVERPDGFVEAGGGGTGIRHHRFVLTETDTSIDLRRVSTSDPGPCDEDEIEAQRRELGLD